MPTLAEAIAALTPFDADSYTAHSIPALKSAFEALTGESDEPAVTAVRSTCTAIFAAEASAEVIKDGISLKQAVHKALLALAYFCPHNAEDPISLGAIEDEKKVAVSTGHQFDIENLVNYHNARPIREAIGETNADGKKWLLNPITNQPFDQEDVRHIQTVAVGLDITIEKLKATVAVELVAPMLILAEHDAHVFAAVAGGGAPGSDIPAQAAPAAGIIAPGSLPLGPPVLEAPSYLSAGSAHSSNDAGEAAPGNDVPAQAAPAAGSIAPGSLFLVPPLLEAPSYLSAGSAHSSNDAGEAAPGSDLPAQAAASIAPHGAFFPGAPVLEAASYLSAGSAHSHIVAENSQASEASAFSDDDEAPVP